MFAVYVCVIEWLRFHRTPTMHISTQLICSKLRLNCDRCRLLLPQASRRLTAAEKPRDARHVIWQFLKLIICRLILIFIVRTKRCFLRSWARSSPSTQLLYTPSMHSSWMGERVLCSTNSSRYAQCNQLLRLALPGHHSVGRHIR